MYRPFIFICANCGKNYKIKSPSTEEAEEQRIVFNDCCIRCYKKLLKAELVNKN